MVTVVEMSKGVRTFDPEKRVKGVCSKKLPPGKREGRTVQQLLEDTKPEAYRPVRGQWMDRSMSDVPLETRVHYALKRLVATRVVGENVVNVTVVLEHALDRLVARSVTPGQEYRAAKTAGLIGDILTCLGQWKGGARLRVRPADPAFPIRPHGATPGLVNGKPHMVVCAKVGPGALLKRAVPAVAIAVR